MSDVLGPFCTHCAGCLHAGVGGVNAAAAVGLCTTQDRVMKCVLLQLLLIQHLLRSSACAVQCCCSLFVAAFILHAALVAHRQGNLCGAK